MEAYLEDIEYFRSNDWKHRELLEFLDDSYDMVMTIKKLRDKIKDLENK